MVPWHPKPSKHGDVKGRWYGAGMAGAIVIAVVMILLIPVGVMLGGAIWSALFGGLESDDAAERAGCEQ